MSLGLRRMSLGVALGLLGASLAAAQAPPAADVLLEGAKAQAAASHRAIFAIFHASW